MLFAHHSAQRACLGVTRYAQCRPVTLSLPDALQVTGTTPVVRSTQHLFLDLPKLTDPLQQYITSASQQGGWSSNCQQARSAARCMRPACPVLKVFAFLVVDRP